MIITSVSNPRIKELKSLFSDKKARCARGVFVAEGKNLVKDIPSGLVEELYIQKSRYEELCFLEKQFNVEAVVLDDKVFDSVADTVTPSGVIAVVKNRGEKTVNGETAVICDGITDAGNMGTIIRTACARGIKTVLCADTVDPFSPKVVRAAMSGIFKINIIACTLPEVLNLVEGYRIVALDMGGESIYQYKMKGKTAVAVGSEAHGISAEIREKSAEILSIPMAEDSVESLNAAVSLAVALYVLKGE